MSYPSDVTDFAGRVCTKYTCDLVATVKTAMGPRCATHADPLMFAVLWEDYRRERRTLLEAAGCPREVPWAFVAPHDDQAWHNHSQSLARLSERGGLAPCELVAVLENRNWEKMDTAFAVARLLELLRAWDSSETDV